MTAARFKPYKRGCSPIATKLLRQAGYFRSMARFCERTGHELNFSALWHRDYAARIAAAIFEGRTST